MKWKQIHRPGGTAIISNNSISTRIYQLGKYSSGLGRWSFISLYDKDNIILIIINAYCSCLLSIEKSGPSIVCTQ